MTILQLCHIPLTNLIRKNREEEKEEGKKDKKEK